MSDIRALERLAAQIKEDTRSGYGLSAAAAASIADIIEQAIGAPIEWPSHVAGVQFANEYYPGSPHLRLAFNHGVKWAVEHYTPTEKPSDRFPKISSGKSP